MASLFGKPQKQNQWFGNQMVIPPAGNPLVNPTQGFYPGYGHTAKPMPGDPDYVSPEEEERRRTEEEERVRREREVAIAAAAAGGQNMGTGQAAPGTPGGYHDPADPFDHLNIHASSSTGPTPYGIPVMKALNENLLGVNDETAAAAAEEISQQFHAQGLPSMNTPHAVDKLSPSAFGYLMDVMGDQDATANALEALSSAHAVSDPGGLGVHGNQNTTVDSSGNQSSGGYGDHGFGISGAPGAGADAAAAAAAAAAENDLGPGFAGIGSIGAGAGADGGPGKGAICTELHRQGYMPPEVWLADEAHVRVLAAQNPTMVPGYQMWARPLARLMRRSPLVTSCIRPMGLAWAQEMAYRQGVVEKSSWLGRLLMAVGIPLCSWLGRRRPVVSEAAA